MPGDAKKFIQDIVKQNISKNLQQLIIATYKQRKADLIGSIDGSTFSDSTGQDYTNINGGVVINDINSGVLMSDSYVLAVDNTVPFISDDTSGVGRLLLLKTNFEFYVRKLSDDTVLYAVDLSSIDYPASSGTNYTLASSLFQNFVLGDEDYVAMGGFDPSGKHLVFVKLTWLLPAENEYSIQVDFKIFKNYQLDDETEAVLSDDIESGSTTVELETKDFYSLPVPDSPPPPPPVMASGSVCGSPGVPSVYGAVGQDSHHLYANIGRFALNVASNIVDEIDFTIVGYTATNQDETFYFGRNWSCTKIYQDNAGMAGCSSSCIIQFTQVDNGFPGGLCAIGGGTGVMFTTTAGFSKCEYMNSFCGGCNECTTIGGVVVVTTCTVPGFYISGARTVSQVSSTPSKFGFFTISRNDGFNVTQYDDYVPPSSHLVYPNAGNEYSFPLRSFNNSLFSEYDESSSKIGIGIDGQDFSKLYTAKGSFRTITNPNSPISRLAQAYSPFGSTIYFAPSMYSLEVGLGQKTLEEGHFLLCTYNTDEAHIVKLQAVEESTILEAGESLKGNTIDYTTEVVIDWCRIG